MQSAGGHEHVQRESGRRASLGKLVSLVADSYEKQTITSHKGSKIKACKEKAAKKAGRGKEPASKRGKKKERQIEKKEKRRHLTLQAAPRYTFSRRPFTLRYFFQSHTF